MHGFRGFQAPGTSLNDDSYTPHRGDDPWLTSNTLLWWIETSFCITFLSSGSASHVGLVCGCLYSGIAMGAFNDSYVHLHLSPRC
ncbi:hypothetical protein CVT25_007546 [Psilocybe cyanescens]|uniref:Uncharacterized protein n=1 Tax=Psilocybe cyanescens TaxID=93625 RepID=A0A409WW30_PSICY|nr:hypothetical protein CVT25_007546 [Psilocybe cyanescens]